MEDNKEAIVQNTEEVIEAEAEEKAEAQQPAVDGAADDDIVYTFVVPKGEIYRDPDEVSEAGEDVPEPVVIEPEPAEADEFDDDGNIFDSDDDFFETYMAADPIGKTVVMEPPVYDETGLPDDDDITYTFVVPKGEVYREPTPEEEAELKKAEKLRKVQNEILSAETKVIEHKQGGDADETSGEKTRYGLPVDHPETVELAQKQEARRIYKQSKKNRFRTRFYVLMTVLILGAGWLLLSNSSLFTIDSIVVQGNKHYTAEEIINMGHASPGRNIIYKANIKEIKEYLENNPYIKSAEVRRKLPSTLVIKVTERKERLAFKYDDDYLVMDDDGILLKKTRNKPKITIIQGIVVNKIKLGEKIGTENSKRMDKVLKLIKTMIKSDLYYVKVDISKEKSVKAYIYDTLVVKADYDALMTSMKNGRLHLVVEKLFEEGIERGTITFEEDGSASFMPIF